MTAYSAALRVSKLVQLRVEDLDAVRMLIRIRPDNGPTCLTTNRRMSRLRISKRTVFKWSICESRSDQARTIAEQRTEPRSSVAPNRLDGTVATNIW